MSEEQVVEETEQAPPPKPEPKRRRAFIAAAVALLLAGSAGAYVLIGRDGGGHEGKAESHGPVAETFVDVPPMVVNLRSPDGAPRFIKLHFMLVPGPHANPEDLTKKLPLLLDAYQPFLRELRAEDLAGSAAVFRIKEEMLVRATDTLGPDQVKDVLIQDLIQQ